MNRSQDFDVAIIGAGPAGTCAALRLLSLGYKVALIERRPFPRPQIGESISAGIWNILDYLDANSILNSCNMLSGLPTRTIWEKPESDVGERQGLIVDRADFDSKLLNLAKMRGASIFQPAQVVKQQTMQIRTVSGEVEVNAKLIFEATGRAGESAQKRFPTAPTTLALWTHISAMAQETSIEAIDNGWLWGTALPSGAYRVMAFLDSATVKQRNKDLENFLRAILDKSKLFKYAATAQFISPVRTCSATPYLNLEPWSGKKIMIGEAAFALDPLSSSGVEKAMRFTLQAVIAANTVLQDSSKTELAKEFYLSRLLESVATHAVWTCSYYNAAWPSSKYVSKFWSDRSKIIFQDIENCPALVASLKDACMAREKIESTRQQQAKQEGQEKSFSPEEFKSFLNLPIFLSPATSLTKTPCVVDDRVELHTVVTHPKLERPVGFLAGFELARLLQQVPHAATVGQLIGFWSAQMRIQTATEIVLWLQNNGLLQTAREFIEPDRGNT